jgi:hypothetical protein
VTSSRVIGAWTPYLLSQISKRGFVLLSRFQANIAAIRADPDYDLRWRIDLLLYDGYWGEDYGLARRSWESQLLVEYLGEVEDYRLADLVREEVTEASTRERMLARYRSAAEAS